MSGPVETISPTATLVECARKMKERDIGFIPVCDHDRIVGVVTDRDLVIRAIAESTDPATTPVTEVMSAPALWCYEDEDIERVVRVMEVRQVRRILVLNRRRRLSGVASIGDLAVKTGNEELSGEVLEKVSEPVRGNAA